jgi:hypothetical protein
MSFCLSVVNSFAVFSIVKEMPVLILRLRTWDVIGAAAYSITFALVEGLVVFCILTCCAVLMRVITKQRHFILYAVLLWPTILFFILFIIAPKAISLIGFLASFILVFLLLRFKKLRNIILEILDRITVLGALYLIIDIVSVIIVVFRNVF